MYRHKYTGDKMDNLLDAISGKNLLHNWDFRSPVNQRSQNSYTSGHTIDRWKIDAGNLTVSVPGGRVTILPSAAGYNYSQTVENADLLSEAKVTLSAICSGKVTLILGVYKDGQMSYPVSVTHEGAKSLVSVSYQMPSAVEGVNVYFQSADTSLISLYAVKLELGAVSTLANDPPADYSGELLKCKRFYRLWITEAARAAALQEVGLMRVASPTTGTITIGGTAYYYADANL